VAARAEIDQRKRFQLFSQAEQIVLDEGAFMPLFYDENLRLEQKNVRNLLENPLSYMDMSSTYLISKTK
jgi:ABC-type transport system substrate-binding protein